ncbi:MAG: Fe-S protein assembly co-chaperone HscB [Magnetococcus sp. YQC-3]
MNPSRSDTTPLSVPDGMGKSCWSCRGLVAGVPFCPTCQAIQPPDMAVDFFQLFGLPVAFSLEMAALEASYQALQRQFHPDRFATRSTTERRLSLEHVTRINQAYQTLRDPLARSSYLLTRMGHQPVAAEGQDPEFLLEVMEQREALAEVDLASTEAIEALARLRAGVERHIEQELQRLTRLFVSATPEEMSEIARINHRLQYHRRFLEALDQAEETIYLGGML